MKKRYLLLLIGIGTFSYLLLKEDRKPKLHSIKNEDGWYIYRNEFCSFEYPFKLYFKEYFLKLKLLPIFHDSLNNIEIFPHAGGFGMQPIESIINQQKPIKLPKEIIDSLQIRHPNFKSEYFDSIRQHDKSFKIIDYVLVDTNKQKYVFRIEYKNEIFETPINTNSHGFQFALNHEFEFHEDEKYSRKIYYNKNNPNLYASCFVDELGGFYEPISITIKRDSSSQFNSIRRLEKDEVIRILKSFKPNKQ